MRFLLRAFGGLVRPASWHGARRLAGSVCALCAGVAPDSVGDFAARARLGCRVSAVRFRTTRAAMTPRRGGDASQETSIDVQGPHRHTRVDSVTAIPSCDGGRSAAKTGLSEEPGCASSAVECGASCRSSVCRRSVIGVVRGDLPRPGRMSSGTHRAPPTMRPGRAPRSFSSPALGSIGTDASSPRNGVGLERSSRPPVGRWPPPPFDPYCVARQESPSRPARVCPPSRDGARRG